ncbi:MAG: hypothetical protein HY671_00105 [Chloroflexi bacterium]|nr:hypothetical protein [Chloroflexota bacterium]
MQFLGWIGFILVESFYVPQLIKTVRTRNVSGFSLTAWAVLWLGMAFYLVYSIMIHDPVFTVGNGVGLGAASFQIALILKYRKRGG